MVWPITRGREEYSIVSTRNVLTWVALSVCISSCVVKDVAFFQKEGMEMTGNDALIAEVAGALLAAEQAMESQNWILANAELKRGLEVMGSRYVSPNVIDDSGMKLVLARVEEQKGDVAKAVAIRRRILGERLELLKNNSTDK